MRKPFEGHIPTIQADIGEKIALVKRVLI